MEWQNRADRKAFCSGGGIHTKVQAIKPALNIQIPDSQMLNIVSAANATMGIQGQGALPVQIDALMAALGL